MKQTLLQKSVEKNCKFYDIFQNLPNPMYFRSPFVTSLNVDEKSRTIMDELERTNDGK